VSDEERGPEIIDAHQELVRHIEQGAGRMRVLSAITVVVAAVLAVSYVSQLALPLAGVKVVTVDLTAPGNVAAEVIVAALALLWLYVGARDLRFAWKVRGEIRTARTKEDGVSDRLRQGPRQEGAG
jgi:hypothetical protein